MTTTVGLPAVHTTTTREPRSIAASRTRGFSHTDTGVPTATSLSRRARSRSVRCASQPASDRSHTDRATEDAPAGRSPSVNAVVDTSSLSTPPCDQSCRRSAADVGSGVASRAPIARSTRAPSTVPSSRAWLLPATEYANSVRPTPADNDSRATHRTAVVATDWARPGANRPNTGRMFSSHASTQGSASSPADANAARIADQSSARVAALVARAAGRSTSGPRRAVTAATKPGATPVSRRRASTTARSTRARSSTRRPISPVRACRSSRDSPSSTITPRGASPLRSNRDAAASHNRSRSDSATYSPTRWRWRPSQRKWTSATPGTDGSRRAS